MARGARSSWTDSVPPGHMARLAGCARCRSEVTATAFGWHSAARRYAQPRQRACSVLGQRVEIRQWAALVGSGMWHVRRYTNELEIIRRAQLYVVQLSPCAGVLRSDTRSRCDVFLKVGIEVRRSVYRWINRIDDAGWRRATCD
jgi:hypothetical protein